MNPNHCGALTPPHGHLLYHEKAVALAGILAVKTVILHVFVCSARRSMSRNSIISQAQAAAELSLCRRSSLFEGADLGGRVRSLRADNFPEVSLWCS